MPSVARVLYPFSTMVDPVRGACAVPSPANDPTQTNLNRGAQYNAVPNKYLRGSSLCDLSITEAKMVDHQGSNATHVSTS